jgi:hypothetical protein
MTGQFQQADAQRVEVGRQRTARSLALVAVTHGALEQGPHERAQPERQPLRELLPCPL